jgi:hypothetical protein
MNKKQQRALHGPSIIEVLLGAVLSLVLGVAIAAAFLVFNPVVTVKEMPKEPAKGVVYYIEGSRDGSKAKQAPAKQKTFVQGGSVTFNEDELNVIMGAAAPAAPAPAPGKKAPAAPEPAVASSGQTISAGSPNFKIKDSVLQIGVPLELSAFGFAKKVILQTRGGFAKNGDTVQFVPGELYLGSCPLQRLPGVQRILFQRVMAASKVPEELTAAWAKLASATVEGSNLQLSMQ